MDKKRTFRIVFLVSYATLAIGCFLIIVRMVVLYGARDNPTLKIALSGISGTASFIGAFHPLIRNILLGRGRLTRLGRWVARTFEVSADEIPGAISFPWQATLLLGVGLFFVNFVVTLIGK